VHNCIAFLSFAFFFLSFFSTGRAGAVEELVEENIAAMYGGGPIAKVRDPFGFSWYICKSTSGPQTSLPKFM